MGGWGSGRQGGRVSIGDCSSCRLSIRDLRSLLRAPECAAQGCLVNQPRV